MDDNLINSEEFESSFHWLVSPLISWLSRQERFSDLGRLWAWVWGCHKCVQNCRSEQGKKLSRLPHIQSTGLWPAHPASYSATVYGWSRGSGVFSICAKKSSS
jgi:hypothetical protein